MPDYRARRAPPARRRASPSSCSSRPCAPPSPTSSAPVAGRARRRPRALGRELDVRQLATGDAARRDRRLPGQVRDQEHRAGRRAAAPRRPDQVDHAPGARARPQATCAPRSSSTRSPTAHREHAQAARRAGPAPDVETDWNPAALAIRVRRAMSTDEPLRVRLHDGTAHTGRIVAAVRQRPRARRHDARRRARRPASCVHLADVASIGPADRAARAIAATRGSPRARTRSATAGTA